MGHWQTIHRVCIVTNRHLTSPCGDTYLQSRLFHRRLRSVSHASPPYLNSTFASAGSFQPLAGILGAFEDGPSPSA